MLVVRSRRTVHLLTLLTLLPVAACRGGSGARPAEDDLRIQLGVEVPAYWRVQGLTISSEQLPERPTDPYRARFSSEIELIAPLFVEAERVADTLVLRQTVPARARRTVYGQVTARREGGRWLSTLQLDNRPVDTLGRPRDFFQAPVVIVAGTPEERSFWNRRRQSGALQPEAPADSAPPVLEAYSAEETEQVLRQRLVGVWSGQVFDFAEGRLTIRETQGRLRATLLNDGYREELRVEFLPRSRVRLTGESVVREDGASAANYSLDIIEVGLAEEGTILQGAARDYAGATGPFRMRRLRAEASP